MQFVFFPFARLIYRFLHHPLMLFGPLFTLWKNSFLLWGVHLDESVQSSAYSRKPVVQIWEGQGKKMFQSVGPKMLPFGALSPTFC